MKKALVKLILEISVILAASLGLAVTVNALRRDSLPLFRDYAPAATALPIAGAENIAEIDLDTLRALIDGGMALPVDARDEISFSSGHIPGACNLPLGDRDNAYARLREELRDGRTLVAYCIDRGCLDSSQLAAWLLQQGHHDVMVYRGGIEGWKNGGNPVEKTP